MWLSSYLGGFLIVFRLLLLVVVLLVLVLFIILLSLVGLMWCWLSRVSFCWV